MAVTSTLKAIADELVEETGIGFSLPTFTSTATALTLTTVGSSETRGPFTGRKIAVGSPVLITAGTGVGEDTFVSDWAPSTGVITVSPAITGGATEAVVITDPGLDHADHLLKAIDRASRNRVRRRQKVPLTYVPDGEMLGAVASYWTAAAGTASYASQTGSEVAGTNVLNLTHTAATNVQSNTIQVRSDEVWAFETAIRTTAVAGVTATFTVYDVTNSAAITATYEEGTGSTTSNAFVTQKGTFTIPATCDQLAFRLLNSASGAVQMAPIIAAPRDARSFPFTNRVVQSRVGNFFYAYGGGTASGPDERTYSEPITNGGRTHTFSYNGDHLVVSFNFAPGRVWYDELVMGVSLTALTDTTTFNLDHVVKWAKFELYKFLYQRERGKRLKRDDGVPLPSIWRAAAKEALAEAQGSGYEPEMVTIYGRA